MLHYNGSSRLIATLCCRLLGIPCLGYYGNFVIVAPEDRIALALEAFIIVNRAVVRILKDKESEDGLALDYLGLFASMPDGSRNTFLKLSST